MPKLLVIHLSDIHFKADKPNPVLNQVQAIIQTCFRTARSADACLIAITGDVAFSGSEAEYLMATQKLIDPLVSELKRETGRPVFVSIAPGNHDCVLKPPDALRETIIEAVIAAPDKARDAGHIKVCTAAQAAFFKFVDVTNNPVRPIANKLFWQQDFDVAGKCVRVSTLNAAWMSRLPEEQGQLVFPIGQFESQLESAACLHLALIHHPFNWYTQQAYHDLRKRVRRSCTALLSGHEHVGNAGSIEDQISGLSLFFEAPALQPPEKEAEPGFFVHQFDLDNQSVSTQAYGFSLQGVQERGDCLVQSWADDNLVHSAFDLTQEFEAVLKDAGGNFSHAAKEQLTLDDLFVWPDLRDGGKEDIAKARTQSAKGLITKLVAGTKVILYGDEKSSKTTLLYRYFRELISRGVAPVYLAATELTVSSDDETEKRINRAITRQYKHPEAIQRLSREKRVLLIDDIDRLKSGVHSAIRLTEYGARHFCSVCLTASTGFEVTNLTSQEATLALSSYESFDVRRFGLKLRHQLIKKWCALSVSTTKQELDKRVDEVESIVNSVIGRRLVPEYPIYLLILLQSCEQHSRGEIQNSGLSFYYQYLITKSLGQVGVKPAELDEHFNYLSILAWHFKTTDAKELPLHELARVNQEFSERFVRVDLGDRLKLLTKSKILFQRGDCYSFAYPYVYYFFIGKYLAKHLDDPVIRTWIEESCRKLYLRDRAHCIMFLTHHSESRWVIDLIANVLRDCFADKQPIELDGDTSFLNSLVERAAQLTLDAPDVDRNQQDIRELSDQLAEREMQEEPDEFDLMSFAAKWNLLHKTAEILGLILKNYYGSLERTLKQELIRDVFNGPLRALRLLLEEIATDLPGIVSELKRAAQEDGKTMTEDEADKYVKGALFSILGWVSTGVVAACANSVAAEKLREDIAEVVLACPTNAYRLIEAASRLLKPGAVPMDSVKQLASDLEKNPYAFGVLQSLGFYHMYMHHTDGPQKQALCSHLKISFESAKAIEIKKPGGLLTKR